MKVFLAGRVAVETDAGATDDAHFPGRQGRLLFALLVLEHDLPVPRDQLAAALWAYQPPATWDKALSVLASKLRAMLTSLGIDGARAPPVPSGATSWNFPQTAGSTS